MTFAAFDLDDTLNLLRDAVCTAMTRRGYPIRVEDMHSYDWQTLFGTDAPSVSEVLLADRLMERAEPDERAIRSVRELLRAGVEVEIWTARDWFPNAHAVTRNYLDRVGLRGVGLRLVGMTASKQTCLQGRIPDLYVDDSAKHIAAMRAAGVSGAQLVQRPWNQRESLPRCACVSEAAARLLEAVRPAPDESELVFGY